MLYYIIIRLQRYGEKAILQAKEVLRKLKKAQSYQFPAFMPTNLTDGGHLRRLRKVRLKHGAFVKIFPSESLSDGLFFLLWHFATPKAK